MAKNKKKRHGTMLKYVYSVLFLIIMFALIFNEFGLYKLYVLYSRKLDLETELASLYAQQEQLREDNLRLEIDLEHIEQIAREKYMMVKDNEKVYRIRYEKTLDLE
ncbi:MAG: hypothetical protein CMG64_00850 [Candidatus Marinimicrobia bacterium]|nr:hypothetical protein [Candidatus Neomarinimicrobiota bacterium]|tara:strand:- start:2510 stop:2827 length:318 start_codon:yes stop_codon:yes gene_type:complete